MVCSSRTSSWYRLAAAAASPSRVSSCSTAERACSLQEMTAVNVAHGSATCACAAGRITLACGTGESLA